MDRLNEIRRQTGAEAFAHSPLLAVSAQSHADYLSLDGGDGHEEHNPDNPYFSGLELAERTDRAGYFADSAENLVSSPIRIGGRRATDELMTALYHRFSLLNPHYDEAAAGWAHRRHTALVFNQGSSGERTLCEQLLAQGTRPAETDQGGELIYCKNSLYPTETLPPPPALPAYIAYPVGSGIEPAYLGDETPNPMPGYEKTGNPISIAFYRDAEGITALSFKLFGPEGEILPTHLMTAANDPNAVMGSHEFALFPLNALQFATDYRAEFRYQSEQNKQPQTIRWTFRTREKRSWFE